MSLITSFFNKAIIKSDLKRMWWISALNTIAMFLTGTIVFFTRHFQDSYVYNNGSGYGYSIYQLTSILRSYYLLALFVPVVLGVLIFSYMHSSKASTFVHSLPVSRGCQYISHIISGVILYSVPILINLLIIFIFKEYTYANMLNISDILRCTGEAFLLSTLTFSAASFVSFIAGNTIASFVFTYIFGALPAFAEAFISYFMSTQLFGYEANRTLPVSEFLYKSSMDISSLQGVLTYTILSLVLLLGGYYIYKLRNLENHSEVVAFPKLRPVFIYGVGICSGCVGFGYFNSIWDISNALWLIPLGVLGIIIAQMIVKKSFRIPEVYKPVIGYVVIILAVFVVFNFDLTGYEMRVPDIDDVEYVTFSQNNLNNDSEYRYDSDGNMYFVDSKFSPDITDRNSIEQVIAFHKHLALKQTTNDSYEYISLQYKLNNGKIIKRKYEINMYEHKELIKDIVESDIARKQYFPILRDDNRKINSISINDYRLPLESFRTIYPTEEDYNKLLLALKKDLLAADYDEYAYRTGRLTYLGISFTTPGHYIDGKKVNDNKLVVENEMYYIRPSYTNTISLLKEFGLYDALPTIEEVDKILVDYYMVSENEQLYYDKYQYDKEITDKRDIESIINYTNSDNSLLNTKGSIIVILRDGRSYTVEFSPDDHNLPDCLKM
ncbi:MAG: DUF6449 domain-containing protein [Eubacteriales bacterium]|nr:DUF6449 domain-containing protein [Eubacteriales bacterium]